ncbi:hypothetical protein D3C73_1582540 [compost metagenome]
MILIPEVEKETVGIPDELLHILEFGRNLDCEWVILDADFDIVNDLPTFDW